MRETHPYCRVDYMRRSDERYLVYCGPDDPWTILRVGPLSGYSSWGEQECDTEARWPDLDPDDARRRALYWRDGMLALLRRAFEAGRRSRGVEIRAALEARSDAWQG